MPAPQMLKNGKARYQPFGPTGRRLSFTFPARDLKRASIIASHIDDLIDARSTGMRPSRATAKWIRSLGESLQNQLVREELIEQQRTTTLGDFIDSLIDRSTLKPETVKTYQTTRKRMTQFFGTDCSLATITHEQALDYRSWMLDKRTPRTLSPSTAGREIGMSRQFFKIAIKLGYVEDNPFEGIPAVVRGNPERMHMITRDDAFKLIEACPDSQWKLLIALARFAGLRISSEVRNMLWKDVDSPSRKLLIRSTKTEHKFGGARLFPEVMPHLEAWANDSDTSGLIFNLPMTNTAALRKPFMAIIKRAGLKVWPKLWQNLRSSCITDAEKLYHK